MQPPVAGGVPTTDKTMRSYTCEAWLLVESTRVGALTTGKQLRQRSAQLACELHRLHLPISLLPFARK